MYNLTAHDLCEVTVHSTPGIYTRKKKPGIDLGWNGAPPLQVIPRSCRGIYIRKSPIHDLIQMVRSASILHLLGAGLLRMPYIW